MTDRARALLDLIAADYAQLCAARAVKRYTLAGQDVSPAAIQRILHGKNHRITTLVEAADLLNADVVITFVPRGTLT
jgi:hypothetical protein